jgi:hypothetical protein
MLYIIAVFIKATSLVRILFYMTPLHIPVLKTDFSKKAYVHRDHKESTHA